MPCRARRVSEALCTTALLVLVGCGASPPKDSGGTAGDEAQPGGPRTASSEDGRFELAYVPSPDPIPLSDDVTLSWTVTSGEPLDALVLTADAWMPTHGHGMNTTPSTTGSGESWQTEGVLLHMPGDWELVVELRGVGATTTVSLPFHCCED